jgi:AraC family transcriptional regulator of adaptative response / DNA-3-methyladenine glycosylase II
MDISSHLARRTACLISQDFLTDHSLSDLATTLGVTDRQMRRVFHEEFGVSPVEFWQTRRLLLAKQLLTDTTMPVTSVAMASGFQSLRRFNALVKERYRLAPTQFRKQQQTSFSKTASDISLGLAYRPPLDWNGLLGFFSQRTISHVEAVHDGAYFRTVRLKRHDREFSGYIQVRHDETRQILVVRVSSELLPVCAFVLERVKQLFDLHADPVVIAAALGPLAKSRPGLRVPGSYDSFEMAVRAILGQQISVAAARTLAGRLVLRFGSPVSTAIPELTHLFPTPQRMARASVDDIGKLGIIGTRARTLIALAQAVASGQLLLDPGQRIEDVLRQLRELPGVGEWTAQYIAMRALSWPDAFPHSDLGLRKALQGASPRKVLELAEKWRPWRAYAALHLWAGLE